MTPSYKLKFYLKNWRLAMRALLGRRAKVDVGAFSYGVPAVRWWGEDAGLTIGKFCSIAKNVSIFLGGNHRIDWITTYPFSVQRPWRSHTGKVEHPVSRGDVIIGNDVWLGNGCTILSGVTIGDGAVVAANATVTKSIPPYAIAAGNPAKVVRLRFSEAEIQQLLSIKWWNWDEARIRPHLGNLLSNDIASLGE
jgi:acetyltransferase-like isoleucine patch superfamily enzyme